MKFALHTVIGADYLNGSVAFDDCALELFPSLTRVSDLQGVEEGMPASVAGKVVIVGLDCFFYIEEPDRSSGIKVIGTAGGGDIVSVRGRMKTVNGERTLISEPGGVFAVPGGAIPHPLGMSNRSACALLATGLYATVWGEVTSVDPANNSFTLTDGSGIPLKVYGSPGTGDCVRVTGAIGAELAVCGQSGVVHCVSVEKQN